MIDKPEMGPAWVKMAWDSAQRIGMRIAEIPTDKREVAFATAERGIYEEAIAGGAPEDWAKGFATVQLQVIRETVEKIDLSGGSQGGTA